MSLAFSVMEGIALKSIGGDPADTTPLELLKALARTGIAAPGTAERPQP